MTTIEINGLLKVPNNKYADHNIVASYKGRVINLEKLIKVYKNLHKNCYSIKQGTLVIAHAERLCLKNVSFKVNEKKSAKSNRIKTEKCTRFHRRFLYD